MNLRCLNIVLTFFAVAFLSSCEKQEALRTYTEITVDASENISRDEETDPHAGLSKDQLAKMLLETVSPQFNNASEKPITWTVPEDWIEKPGNGMRVASFVNKNAPAAIDCSIVTLGAGAGGLAPNVVRWIEQLNIPVPSETELENFIEKQKKITLDEGLFAWLIDFTDLQKKADDSSPSMMAAIIDTSKERIFIKMTGSKQKIYDQSQNFKALVQSLKFKK